MTVRAHTILKLAVEYSIVTSPIAIYAVLEAIHKDDFIYIFRSPEWSVATIFLTVQAIRMYLEQLRQTLDPLLSVLLMLFLTGITLAAAINIYIALGCPEHQSLGTQVSKWVLFVMATIVFVLIAGGAIYGAEPEDA